MLCTQPFDLDLDSWIRTRLSPAVSSSAISSSSKPNMLSQLFAAASAVSPVRDGKKAPKSNVDDLEPPLQGRDGRDDCSATDSGYGTAPNSPGNDKSADASQENSERIEDSPACTARPIPLPLTGNAKLQQFKKEVNKATIDRFNDVVELLSEPLLSYLQKSKPRTRPCRMAIRLVVLGKTADDAKPCIVVLCDRRRSERVKRFFDKGLAKDVCKPEDPMLPSFDVHIFDYPPQTKAARVGVDVYGGAFYQSVNRSATTTCGTLIKLVAGDQIRFGTIGGIIKVTMPGGEYELYGMTAGHLTEGLLQDEESQSDDDQELSSSDEDDADVFDDNDASDLLASSMTRSSMENPDMWVKLGNSLLVAGGSRLQHHLDWELVENLSPSYYRPNQLPPAESHPRVRQRDLVKPLKSLGFHKARPVVVMSGSRGLRRGMLSSSLPSLLLLSPGQKFVQTHILTLDNDSEICEGDSGSWAVDETTLEVYGHVVASDIFGDTYVLPLLQTFDDIREHLGAVAVNLPTNVDIICKQLDNLNFNEPAVAVDYSALLEEDDAVSLSQNAHCPPRYSGYSP
ncbi:hypothetical protein VTN77DRAFT_7312 [Rasamsonia byssochlamydoides]|uniref:uncharacterized protein n=1 Tax=Rasamsonia byssochlamydoides TaxID=89139 RepID=UPI003742FCD0